MKKILFPVLLALVLSGINNALFAQTMTFKTSELHYGNCPSPDETLSITWDELVEK
ncbi:MAG: hypothetical protein IPL65_17585 [Lewinellaceae bacterium]|nr:hypothetical protein [Lewinellaceae bacterium]